MLTFPNHLIIVEGPAGSGKSTLASAISHRMQIPNIRSSLPTRTPHLNGAMVESAINDYRKICEALTQGDHAAVIDRLVFSQMVYGALRQGADLRQPDAVGGGYTHLDTLVVQAREDLIFRGWEAERRPIHLDVVIMLPSAATIRVRRLSTGGRVFNWDPQEELNAYHRAAWGYVSPRKVRVPGGPFSFVMPTGNWVRIFTVGEGPEVLPESLAHHLEEVPHVRA